MDIDIWAPHEVFYIESLLSITRTALINVSQQINQVGNLDGFYKIFEDRGILLNEHDRETIKHRNNFLHGRLLEDSLKTQRKEYLPGVILKMHFLLSVLILTDAGYDGYYFNNYKFRLKNDSTEPLYRKMNE